MKGIPPGAKLLAIVQIVDGKAVSRHAPGRDEALASLDQAIREHVRVHGRAPSYISGWRNLQIKTNQAVRDESL